MRRPAKGDLHPSLFGPSTSSLVAVPASSRDAASAAQRLPLREPVSGCIYGLVASFGVFIAELMVFRQALPVWAPLLVLVGPPVLAGLLATLAFWGPSARLGEDGLFVGKPFRRRFIPLPVLDSFERSGDALVVRLRGGRAPIHLSFVGAAKQISAAEARLARMIATAQERRARAFGVLERGGRTVTEWRSALATVLTGGGFRDAAVSQDQIEDVLDDPAATVEQRIGAALALRAADRATAAGRIRVAAESSAHPRLRVALERVADDDDATSPIEEALEDATATQESGA